MKSLRSRIIATLIAFITGFIMFSMANATTPAENKAAGEKFLADNAQTAGVITTASGLQYLVFNEGSGAMPKATDNVTVHYKGTTIDGKEFDSSYGRGAPATFPLNRVIAGWTEGLQLMKEGAKYRFFIPSNLAYGERGAGRDIGPNAALIFDVELIKVD
ncbi:FKBP-type peptidyl-prolyl cis-trans isomerase [Methylomonas sp. SURF-2]|uniref:Peptidyl-prolyl cis-trans isomerase n=1 Tax=Methylomonas subterranea TaxID=2952225 RepID=A0ABT1TGN9_9GAMM|nr:FKBP-type peptidyl-prolyl cis-trans isomerase [Methylomonas sp. SURF-2]MCQ8104416.1 FKBP-type peptidyl-prolyl cis-trans isomerase [Methylomonas sp. SURF-2]